MDKPNDSDGGLGCLIIVIVVIVGCFTLEALKIIYPAPPTNKPTPAQEAKP